MKTDPFPAGYFLQIPVSQDYLRYDPAYRYTTMVPSDFQTNGYNKVLHDALS